MKFKGFSIGIIFLEFMVCTTCTKDEILPTPDGESSALKTAPVENVVITVEPSGGDDTQAVLNAFEAAKAAGQGSIVYLTEGIFHLSAPVIVEDFVGTMIGAGKNSTEILTGGLGESMFTFQSLSGAYSISISDLTLRYTHLSAPEPVVLKFHEGVLKSYIHIQNVDFIGTPDQCSDATVICVSINPLYNPNVTLETVIEGCTFDQVGEAIKILNDMESSFLILGNMFINCVNGIVQFDSNSSVFEVVSNRFEFKQPKCYPFTAGVYLFGGNPQAISRFLIQQNDFIIDFASGIGLLDISYFFDGAKSMDVEIKSNKFLLNDIEWDGITNLASQDVIIGNNKFEGNALTAVGAGWWNSDWPVENMIILGDNVNSLFAQSSFPIVLTEKTSNCIVIGNSKDNVLNLGTNNILTGVNNMGSPLGIEVSEAMNRRNQGLLTALGLTP